MLLVFLCFSLALGFTLVFFIDDFQKAKSVFIPLVYLFSPIWVSYRFGGVELDLRFFLFFVVLVFFIISNPLKNGLKFHIADFFAILLISGMALSQYHQGYFGPSTLPEILRKWIFPYLLGRWFLESWNKLGSPETHIRWILLILAIFSFFESLVHVNPLQFILQKRFALLEEGEGYRWGIKRAMGALGHPIFFGMSLVCLLPWSLLTAERAWRNRIPRFWVMMPIIHAAMIIVTGSRGPMIASAMVFGGYVFFSWPKLRWALGGLGIALALLILFWREEGLEMLGSVAGDNVSSETRMVTIDGVEYEYTGTAHRFLLFKVYASAIEKAGWLGYSVNHLEGMKQEGIGLDPNLEIRFGSIDNGFLYLLLQHGWLSVLIFLLFSTSVIGTGVLLGFWLPGQPGVFAGTLAVALLAVFLGLNSVWFSADFSAIWLFHAGFLVSLSEFPTPLVFQEKTLTRNTMGLPRNLPKTSRLRPL